MSGYAAGQGVHTQTLTTDEWHLVLKTDVLHVVNHPYST
jgi:hypothetical protein